VATESVRARLAALDGGRRLDHLGNEVAAGRLDPYAAAAQLLDDDLAGPPRGAPG
jgi:hypothetical protein